MLAARGNAPPDPPDCGVLERRARRKRDTVLQSRTPAWPSLNHTAQHLNAMKSIRTILPLMLAALVALACEPADRAPAAEPWQPLFDGQTLEGWENPYDWGDAWVEDGEIRLLGDRKFFLTTTRPYRDFVFESEILMPEGQANSGFMFRAHVDSNNVVGYQAEVDPSDRRWSGGLYDEGRRGWLHPVRGDSVSEAAFREQGGHAYRHGEWNHYRIEAIGDRLKIWVNDVLTTEIEDTMDREGYLGLQHHGEEGQVYRFRNIRIQEVGETPDHTAH
jgi:hypothetical protein